MGGIKFSLKKKKIKKKITMFQTKERNYFLGSIRGMHGCAACRKKGSRIGISILINLIPTMCFVILFFLYQESLNFLQFNCLEVFLNKKKIVGGKVMPWAMVKCDVRIQPKSFSYIYIYIYIESHAKMFQDTN